MAAKINIKGVSNINTTTGVIWKQLLLFALPLLFSNFLQQLYSTVDLLIVGNYASDSALAAVGSTGALTGLIVGLFIGISVGASVAVSQAYGAGDDQALYRHVHSAMFLGLVSGISLTLIGIFISRPLLMLMDTPAELLPEAVTYMQIVFVGMIPISLYNMTAGVLRAVGDSRRPLIFLMISAVINLALDMLFVAVLSWGVAGAAWATVISQTVSLGLGLATLTRSETPYRLFVREIKAHKKSVQIILKIGLPAGLQSVVISFANTIVQSQINGYGAFAVEGYAAANRIDGFYYMCINSFSLAMTTFVGQNIGAKRYDRVRQSIKVAIGVASGIAMVLGVIVLFNKRSLLGIFGTHPDSLPYGELMLTIAAFGYWVFAIGDVLSGAFRGAGNATFPMVSSLINMCVVRLVWVFAAQQVYPNILSVFLAYPVSWLCQSALMLVYYFKGKWLPKAAAVPEPQEAEPALLQAD
ncbi:MAG: MATE family efflux transporter [Clostridia bacterium]|nr:MATE family efflux transporter [Clostridia bacterium]